MTGSTERILTTHVGALPIPPGLWGRQGVEEERLRREVADVVRLQRQRFTNIVGRERVIAGTDCGLGLRCHPQVAWATLKALAEGAARASKALNFLMQFVKPDLHLSDTQVGMLSSGLSLTFAISSVWVGRLAGRLSDHFNDRSAVLWLMLAMTVLAAVVGMGLRETAPRVLARRAAAGFRPAECT